MSKTLYSHRWMDLKEDPNREAFVVMHHAAVMLIPVTNDGQILFVEEKSIAYQASALTLPTGVVEADESPAASANRELQEEVGFRAESLAYLGLLHPAVKYMQWQCHVFLAHHLVRAKRAGDETSPVKVCVVPLSELATLIQVRKLSDATSLAALHLAHVYLHQAGKGLD